MTRRRPNGLLDLYVWPYLSLHFVGRFSGEPGLANLAFFTVTVTLNCQSRLNVFWGPWARRADGAPPSPFPSFPPLPSPFLSPPLPSP